MEIIIDDFGLTNSINEAVVELHSLGIITGASIMYNKDFTDEAIELALLNGITVGLHFNITQGDGLSKELALNMEIHKVREELEKQLSYFNNKGIKITYIDMHHNINFIRNDIDSMLKEYGLRVREKNNCYTGIYKNRNFKEIVLGFFKDEIMLHPATYSEDLIGITEYTYQRVEEFNLLKNNANAIKALLKNKNK